MDKLEEFREKKDQKGKAYYGLLKESFDMEKIPSKELYHLLCGYALAMENYIKKLEIKLGGGE
jgi:hypothetical protein